MTDDREGTTTYGLFGDIVAGFHGITRVQA